jgi:hypothetical protein
LRRLSAFLGVKMKQDFGSDEASSFALDEQAKAEKLLRLKQRLAAATPVTAKPKSPRFENWDVRRAAMAGFLALIFLGAIVVGSGVF